MSTHDTHSPAERVPVTLLTGFLGAGKTTLVNRILTERHGEPIAVLVNEFGDVPIDGRLVVRADEEVVELANGCICCSVRGDLVRAVSRLLRRRRRRWAGRPFSRLLVETSGLASPGPVLQTLLVEPELAAETRATGVVTLAHAALIGRQLEEHPEAWDQVGYADLLVLNHVDRVNGAGLDEAERRLRACNPLAPIVRTERAALDVSSILGLTSSLERPHDARAGAAHSAGAGTVVLRTHRALRLDRLKMWLQFLANRRSGELWRVKGIVRCDDLPHAVVAQGVHQFLELGPGRDPAPEESVLVLIGRDLDADELERGWAAVSG